MKRSNPRDMLPAAEIKVALIDIMGTITAMVEELLPKDMQAWAEGLAAQFEARFHTSRASLTTQELNLLQAARGSRPFREIPSCHRLVVCPRSFSSLTVASLIAIITGAYVWSSH